VRSSRATAHAVAGMVRATQRMQDWLVDHDAAELARVTAPFYSDVAPNLLLDSLWRYRDAGIWARTTEVSRQGFARLAESLVTGGFLSGLPSYDDFVDRSFDGLEP
jgi:NitT/TauT family transport system substrate-binding protein